MTELDLVWLAGYLEGEGCFIASGRGCPRVVVSATDFDVMERAGRLMGCRVRSLKVRPGHKPAWRAEVSAVAAVALMQRLLPHMGERRSKRIVEVIATGAARPGTARGETHGQAKLTNDQVREIRDAYATGNYLGLQRDMARKYGMSQAAIGYVLKGKTYRDTHATLIKR